MDVVDQMYGCLFHFLLFLELVKNETCFAVDLQSAAISRLEKSCACTVC